MGAHACDRFGPAHHEPHLRAADQLVAGGRDEVGAGRDAPRDERLVLRQRAAAGERDERAAAQVVGHGDAVGAAERHEVLEGDLALESDDAVVRRVDAQEEAGLRADRALVVGEMRAVRGPDLAQDRARLRHDLRDPVGAADLDQLPAGDDHLLPRGGRREHDEGRGGVVVDGRRGLASRQAPKQRVHVALAGRALPGLAVRGEEEQPLPSRATASRAEGGSGARPRFVWRTTPVALTTRTRPGSRRRAMRFFAAAQDGVGGGRPLEPDGAEVAREDARPQLGERESGLLRPLGQRRVRKVGVREAGQDAAERREAAEQLLGGDPGHSADRIRAGRDAPPR